MTRFDSLVQEALRERSDLAPLRPVVEKELLHQDILREMGSARLLQDLVFIGGTCLRVCHGSPRLSEDLDFTTDAPPDSVLERLAGLARSLEEGIFNRYGLPVNVTEPRQEDGLVRTWKLRLTAHPERPDLPAQRIHIDVQSLPAHDARPAIPRNPYRVDMGTAGLILNASSLEEIFVDKILALALREHGMKWRDVWDIVWLDHQGVPIRSELAAPKSRDRGVTVVDVRDRITDRVDAIRDMRDEFTGEMRRFLPPGNLLDAVGEARYWEYVLHLIPTLVSALV